MGQEIERKFLVKGDFKNAAFKATRITQGYLCSVPERTAFDKPEWLGEEVTGDVKYYNSMLMKNPYKNWK